MTEDEQWMSQALNLAHLAEADGEVPVGAIVVLDNKIISEGYNQPIKSNDPSAHAEIVALRNAAKTIGNYRLLDCKLYVSLEPCIMCVGAMVHARIKQLIFGAYDPKAGAVTSAFSLLDNSALNHKVSWEGGIQAQACGQVLKEFFKKRR